MGHILRDNNGRPNIPGLALEKYFFEVFDSYLNGLKSLGIAPPLVAMIALEGVEGATYAVKANTVSDPSRRLIVPFCCFRIA